MCRRIDQITQVLAIGLCGLCLVIFIIQRLLSYSANNTELYKLPNNFIERECPAPDYAVLGVVVGSSSSNIENKPRICLTTLTDAAHADALQRLVRFRDFNSLLSMTWPNKKNYCRKHGYHLFDESMSLDNSRPPSWSKIRAVQRLLREEACDWVLWLDADTVIMNSEKRIEDFLPLPDSGIDLVLTGQKGPAQQESDPGPRDGWNAGAWAIRNTEWSHQFLNAWWNRKEFVQVKGLSKSGDNDALYALLSAMHPLDSHIVVPPRCLFNSVAKFATKEEHSLLTPQVVQSQWYYKHVERYHKGDLVAHIAGTCTDAHCLLPILHSPRHGLQETVYFSHWPELISAFLCFYTIYPK